MLLYNRRKFLTLAATPLALSACGFTPIYSKGSAAEQMHGRVALGEFVGLDGFQMREQLETRLGTPTAATHRLDVSLVVDSVGVAITQDARSRDITCRVLLRLISRIWVPELFFRIPFRLSPPITLQPLLMPRALQNRMRIVVWP